MMITPSEGDSEVELGDLPEPSATGDTEGAATTDEEVVEEEPKWYAEPCVFAASYNSVLENFIDPDKIFDLDDEEFMEEFRGKGQYAQRMDYKDHTVVKSGTIQHAGRDIQYRAVGLPSRTLWREYSRRSNRMIRYRDEDGEIQEKYWMEDGNFVASKNMPSSVKLEQRDVGGGGGYWKNIHILIQDNQIVFDEGRKTITGAKPGVLAAKLVPVFKEIYEYIWHYTGKDMPPLESRAVAQKRRDQRFAGHHESEGIYIVAGPIADAEVRYTTIPDQEAPVQSLFNQLIAAGYLPYYNICTEGYKKQYDCDLLYIIYTDEDHFHEAHTKVEADEDGAIVLDLVAEYKAFCETISNDIKDDGPKSAEDLDLLVCWDIETDFSHKKWKNECETVRVVNDPTAEEFYGTTHHLKLVKVSREIPVIALKHLIDWIDGEEVDEPSVKDQPESTSVTIDEEAKDTSTDRFENIGVF